MFNKKGVSLITVLLFMLIATIAATATFKWLTSENRSSSARMQIQEARLSAIAGIQGTRAWMTSNANDVGALVRQYILGGNQPILLNNRIKNHIDSKQKFNVWLTGISEINGLFKFKIISEGISRNSANHTEAAILNVSGLYQVSPPAEEEKIKNIVYDYTYFGGSVRNNGDAALSSMLINGNWQGNPLNIDKNLIITGNASLSGNKINILGTGCFGGDLYAKNGFDAKNVYINGTAREFGTQPDKPGISNHAYFDGIVEQAQSMPIFIGGNATIKNEFKTHMRSGNNPVTIGGNLCVDSAISQIQIGEQAGSSSTAFKPFSVQGNVWVTHPNAFYAKGGDFSSNYTNLVLGNSTESKIYIPDAYPHSDYVTMRNSKTFDPGYNWWNNYKPYVDVSADVNKYYFYYVEPGITDVSFDGTNYYVGGNQYPSHYNYGNIARKRSPYCNKDEDASRPKLHVTPWFKSNGTLSRDLPTPKPVTCADSVRNVCYDIWEETPGCEEPGFPTPKFKVKDILTSAYDKFVTYADKECSSKITKLDKNFAKLADSCYSAISGDATKKETELYNGYLVVRVSSDQLVQETDYEKSLDGKFIIILSNHPDHTVMFPSTKDDDDYVFLYLEQGASTIQGADNKTYNYFIYTPADIGKINKYTSAEDGSFTIYPEGGLLFNNAIFHGSIYAVAKNCAKISQLWSAKTMEFNQELMNSLNQSRIICDASVTNCGGPAYSSSSAAGPESSASSEDYINGKDPYYISIAPQLDISIESQYKAPESTPTGESSEINPSILVLPRIIYLPRNAKGKLADYYSIVNLNGANETKTPSKVSCNGSFSTTDKLVSTTHLTPGTYKCEYASTNYASIPFYVVVSNTTGEVPEVKFKEPREQSLNLSDATTISVHVGKSNAGSGNIKFDFSVSNTNNVDWTFTPKANVTERSGSGFGTRYFTVEVTPNATEEQDIEILTISTGSNADDGDSYITLSTPTENCKLGAGNELTYHVKVRARISINRSPIETYCDDYPDNCDISLQEKLEHPDCEYVNEWVTVNGTSCTVESTNNSWKCLTNTAISIESVHADKIPSECEIIIPSVNNSINNPVGGESKNLYASLKRKKVELVVNLRNALDKDSYVHVKELNYSLNEICTKENSPCKYQVFAGTPISFSHSEYGEDQNNFNYWQCKGNDCTSETSNEEEPQYIFYEQDTIIAVFNKESHCYYDDFANTSAFCAADEEDCIDTCATVLNASQACAPRNSKQAKSHWLMTYHNNGSGNNASYVRPTFGTSSIFASSSQDKPSIILRNKSVGTYGTMFALVKTSILEESNTSDLLNSGLIFRSNGSEHLILNVYGVSKPGNSGELRFRVCKIEGQSISNTTQGNCKMVTKKEGLSNLSITSNSFIKISLTLNENDHLNVSAKVNDESWEGEVNVKDFGCNDNTHTYVGFSLADPEFKIYDNGWVSSALDETCWEVPTIKCNFVDKYKIVPLGEYVTPKVIISTWFTEKQCTTEYHYNGCDNETSDKNNCSGSNNGEPGEIGATLSGDTYNFSQEGQHGYLVGENKRAQDASIKVVCPGDAGSLDLAQDFYSCGTFHVGTTQSCFKDIDINDEAQYMSGNVPYEFNVSSNEGFNMRDAKLHFHIHMDNESPENKSIDANIKIHLQSTNGMNSLSRTINTSGAHDINVNDLIGTTGFDPQEVSKVIITSDNSITISRLHIKSDCPNKLDLKCESATYDNANKGWKIETNNQPNDVKCSYTSTDNRIEPQSDIIACKNVTLTYSNNENYWGWMFNSIPTFTVTATKNNATVSCTIQGTKTWNNNISCSIPDDQQSIEYGTKAPNFNFQFGQQTAGWNFNTNYKVSLDNTTVIENGSAKYGEQQTYTRQESDEKPSIGDHLYKVDFIFGYTTQSCTAKFTVKDKTKQPPTIDCGSSNVSDNGKFTAVVNNPDDVSYACTFTTKIVVDALGNTNTVDGSTEQGSGSDPIYYTYAPGKAGTYYYTAKIGDSECTIPKTVSSPIELQCPSTISNQSASDAITVSPTVKNCDGCTYKIFDEGLEKSSDLVFYDNNGSGTKQYLLQATDKNENKASCNFTVSFKSQSSESILLDYGADWHFFSEGTHNIKCGGAGGRLVCKCPIAQWGYSNCRIQYNGTTVNLSASNTGGQTVDGSNDDPCKNDQETTLTILPPAQSNPNNQEHAQQQGTGMYCMHAW